MPATTLNPQEGAKEKPTALRWGYFIALMAAGALYVISVAPGPLWQDSGMAQVRVLQHDRVGRLGLALSHPLYYQLAFAFQYLPFGDSAYKTNLVSAVFGAVTVANLLLLVRLITGRWGGAAVGAIALAVAHTFWQHCALAEVYTVTTALLTTELLMLTCFLRTRQPVYLVGLFLANGLGVSNHMLAVLSLACYAGLLIWLLAGGHLSWRWLPVTAMAWLAGASFYIAITAGEYMRGSPLAAVLSSAFFGRGYTGNVLNARITLRELANTVGYLFLNFPTPAALLIPLGFGALLRLEVRRLAAVLTALLVIHFLWALRYNVPDQYTFFIPTVVLAAAVLGLGADRLLQRHPRWMPVLLLAAVLPAGVYVPAPALARAAGVRLGVKRELPFRDEYRYFLHPWKTGYRGPEQFSAAVQSELPTGAILIADGTALTPLKYQQLSGQWRDDLRLVSGLRKIDRGLDQSTLRNEAAGGHVFVVSPVSGYCPAWLLDTCRFEKVGPVYRAVPILPDTAPRS